MDNLIAAGNMANAKAQAIEIDRMRTINTELVEALKRISDGQVMTAHQTWTHADTVHEYQRIASAAIAKGQP